MLIRVTAQIAILLLLVGIVVFPYGLPLSSTPPVQAQAIVPGVCHGDEAISFAPTRPTVGQELRIAVTSATKHQNVYLAGSEQVTTVSETQGRLGVVWLWSLIPQVPGPQSFEFFVDFTTFCAAATIEVAPSPLRPMATNLPLGSTGIVCPTTTAPIALSPLGHATPTPAGGAAYPLDYATPTRAGEPAYPLGYATPAPAGGAYPLGYGSGLATDPTPLACSTATVAPGSTGVACPTATAPIALSPLGHATPTPAGGAAYPLDYATPTRAGEPAYPLGYATPTRAGEPAYPLGYATPTPAGEAYPLGYGSGLATDPTPLACSTATVAGAVAPLGYGPGLATDPTPFIHPTSLPFTDPTPTPFDDDNFNSSNDNSYDNNDNSYDNSNDNIYDDSNDNSFDNDSNSNADELDKPSITSASCSGSTKQHLTIKGNDFGESLGVASGRVMVRDMQTDNAVDVSTYLSWTTKEIAVLVPGEVPKFDEVYVVTSGGTAHKNLSASCSS